ncbi:MAG: hypothetical protein FJW44_05065 [Actinobacteria bacterium]|nr:hypothetical protein [Actinomycetota bacterium]
MASQARAHDSEIVDMVVAYARQETVEPLRGAGRWILWGVVSMVLVSAGMVLVALGLLRLVQDLSSDAFDGAWSFVPYIFGTVFAVVVVGVGLSQMRRPRL